MTLVEQFFNALAKDSVERGETDVIAALDQKVPIAAADWLLPMGGITGAEQGFPLAAPRIIKALSAQYGTAAVTRLRAADARVLRAIRNVHTLRDSLEKAQHRYHPERTDQVGYWFLDKQLQSHNLDYDQALTTFAMAEADDPAGTLEATELAPSAFATVAEMIWDEVYASPAALSAQLIQQASNLVAALQANIHAGTHFVKAVVARSDTSEVVYADEVLAPLAGMTDRNLAIAAARQAGRATAVMQAGSDGRYYILGVSEELPYSPTVSPIPIGRTELNWVNPNVEVLTTAEGMVLRHDDDGRYYSVLDLPHRRAVLSPRFPDNDPTPYLQADYALAAQLSERGTLPEAEQIKFSSGLIAQTVLDTALFRLARAQRDHNHQRNRFGPSSFTESGASLKASTAELRTAMVQVARLGWANRAGKWSSADARSAERLTAKIGQLILLEPLALTYLKVTKAQGSEPLDEHVTDLLAELSSGEAGLRARDDIETWTDNVDKIRKHLLDTYPKSVEHLGALYPEVVLALGQVTVASLANLSNAIDEIKEVLIGVSMAAGAVAVVLLTALVCPPSVLAVGAGFAAFGAVGVRSDFDDLAVTIAMTQINPVGSVQLASEGDISSAQTHAWIGVGLVVIDLILLRSDLGKGLRYVLEGTGIASPVGEMLYNKYSSDDGAELRLLAPAAVMSAAVMSAAVPTAVKPTVPRMWITKPKLAGLLNLTQADFKALAAELRLQQRELRALLVSMLDEPARQALSARIYRAISALWRGGSAHTVAVHQVLNPPVPKHLPTPGSTPHHHLLVGEDAAGIEWASEGLAASKRVDALVPTGSTAADALNGPNARVYKGTLTDLPAEPHYQVAREHLPDGFAVPADPEAFVIERTNLLDPGGLWAIRTKSSELVAAVKEVAPRQGVKIWASEYPTTQSGKTSVTHLLIISQPRAMTTRQLSSMIRPSSLNDSRLTRLLAMITSPEAGEQLRNKLKGYWHRGIIQNGQVAQWQLSILQGNIGEILSREYQQAVLVMQQVAYRNAELFLNVRRITLNNRNLEFTDGIIGVLSTDAKGVNQAQILHVFETKTGQRAERSAQEQLFETSESRLEPGERIRLNGIDYTYAPPSSASGEIHGLLSADRHVIVAKAQNPPPLVEGDEIGANVNRVTLRIDGHEVTQAELEYLVRTIVENLPARL